MTSCVLLLGYFTKWKLLLLSAVKQWSIYSINVMALYHQTTSSDTLLYVTKSCEGTVQSSLVHKQKNVSK